MDFDLLFFATGFRFVLIYIINPTKDQLKCLKKQRKTLNIQHVCMYLLIQNKNGWIERH